MKYKHIREYIQDSSLDDTCGRIVIFENKIIVSFINTSDHNSLLQSFASQYKIRKSIVKNNAVRLYFKYEEDDIIISGIRKIDDDLLEKDFENYLRLIKKKI